MTAQVDQATAKESHRKPQKDKATEAKPQKDTHRNRDAKPINAATSAKLTMIFDRLGSTAESWWSRLIR